jgi:hypothetical protein
MNAKVVKHPVYTRYMFRFQNRTFACANIVNGLATVTNMERGGANPTFKYYIFFHEKHRSR